MAGFNSICRIERNIFIKTPNEREGSLEQLVNEGEYLSRLQGSGYVPPLISFSSSEIRAEVIPGDNLENLILNEEITFEDIQEILIEVNECVEHMHSFHNISHRDLRCANLVCFRQQWGWDVTIVDFGMACNGGHFDDMGRLFHDVENLLFDLT